MLDYELEPDNIHVGPSDHVPWLLDRKYCYIVMEGTTYGDVPLKARAQARGLGQPEQRRRHHGRHPLPEAGPGSRPHGDARRSVGYFMKSPPLQVHDDISYNRVEAFIRGEDNETLVGTEKPVARTLRTLAKAPDKAAVK